MKGKLVVIIDAEVSPGYLTPEGVIPWSFEEDVAALVDLKLSEAVRQIQDPAYLLTNPEVWTLSAFRENGGRLTDDHPDSPEEGESF